MLSRVSRALPALACLVLVACGGASPAPEGGAGLSGPDPYAQPRSGGVLRIGQNAADLGTLDPHFASGTQDRALVDMVFDGLLRYKPGDATGFARDLAATLPGPITNPEGKQTWTFILRRGVLCHPSDGAPVLLNAPWLSVFPGLAMLVTVLAFNLAGDGLRDALAR